jgi:hypothetical protein
VVHLLAWDRGRQKRILGCALPLSGASTIQHAYALCGLAVTARRVPPPWSAEVQPNHYVVRDANRNGDPGGDEAVFNATPGSFWTNVKVGRLQAAALLILK